MTHRIVVLMVLAACGGDASVDPTETDLPPDPPVSDPPITEAAPTWNGDVQSIVAESCGGCHQTDGIGAFSLETYDDAQPWADAMAQAVLDRTMPPWLVTDDGSCGDFANSAWMSDADIQILSDWADAGAPLGEDADPTAIPATPSLDRVDHSLLTPTFAPEIAGGSLAENDEYRCFAFDNPAGADLFVTGFEITPGNDAIVHHVLGMPVDPAAPGWDGNPNALHIQAMDGADGRDGWPCFGTAGGAIREEAIPIVWAPGMGAVAYPEGVGVQLGANDVMIVQVHYNLVDPDTHGQSDSTRIDLRTQDTVEREAYFSFPDDLLESIFTGVPDLIPPGEQSYPYTFTLTGQAAMLGAGYIPPAGGEGFELVGVMPHMHEMGTRQELRVRRADTDEDVCLTEVQQWDFDWQLFYFYDTPEVIAPDDVLEVTCWFDSSTKTEDTLPGWGTDNEMCLMVLMLVPL